MEGCGQDRTDDTSSREFMSSQVENLCGHFLLQVLGHLLHDVLVQERVELNVCVLLHEFLLHEDDEYQGVTLTLVLWSQVLLPCLAKVLPCVLGILQAQGMDYE